MSEYNKMGYRQEKFDDIIIEERNTSEFQHYDIGRLFGVLTNPIQNLEEIIKAIDKCEIYLTEYNNGDSVLEEFWYSFIFDYELDPKSLTILTKNFIKYVDYCINNNMDVHSSILDYLFYCSGYETEIEEHESIVDAQDIIFIWKHFSKDILINSESYNLGAFCKNKNCPEYIITEIYNFLNSGLDLQIFHPAIIQEIKSFIPVNSNTPDWILDDIEATGAYKFKLFCNGKSSMSQLIRVVRLSLES